MEKEKWINIETIYQMTMEIIKEQLESNRSTDSLTEGELKAILYYRSCQKVDKWQTCITDMNNINGLHYASIRLFIRSLPNNHKLEEINKITNSIKNSIIEINSKPSWVPRNTAKNKVNSIRDLIGYPEFVKNDKFMNLMLVEILFFILVVKGFSIIYYSIRRFLYVMYQTKGLPRYSFNIILI